MKKILTMILAGTLVAGAAFADFSVTGNVRIESDVFTYRSPTGSESHDGKFGDGDVNWAKDTKHKDDVTFQASSDNVGAKIVLGISSNTNNGLNGGLELTSYQGWVNNLFGLRLDAGAYDQRLTKNLNNDGDWNKNLSAAYKTGITTSFAGDKWGQDASNITVTAKEKRMTNFQVSKSGLLDGKLTVRGVLFLNTSGTDANGDEHNNDRWIFTPFALGATYALDKNTQFSVVGKLNSITKGNVKYSTTDADGKTKTTAAQADKSVYTLNFDFYKKLGSGIELEAAYTFGMSLYSDWSWGGARTNGNLVRDDDIFAHGVDFRVKGIKPIDALSLTAIANVSYLQGTAAQKKTNRTTSLNAYKDARARSYATHAAGSLAYYAAVSADYQQSDTLTFQVQANIENKELFSVEKGDSAKMHVDYLTKMTLIVRPAVIVNVGGSSRFFAGVQLLFDGFQHYASGGNNKFKVTATVPVGLRIKL